MTLSRVAIIFDNELRPETTGTYCLRALSELVHVEFFTPAKLHVIPRTGFDLYLCIDDGLRYHLPSELKPCAWWVIDTHLDLSWAIDRGQDFDWLFAAQQDGASYLRQVGLPATWLPLACDPTIHRPWPMEPQWDVSFVGRVAPGVRQELLLRIAQEFPRSFIGQRYFEDYAQICSASLVGFNRSVKNDINMRVFETLGCRTLLVTNDLSENGQAELFQVDQHFVTYRDGDELFDKIRFYLRHAESRQRIANLGHRAVLEKHTYRHRMQHVLEQIARSQSRMSALTSRLSPDIFAATSVDWIHAIDFVIKTFLRPQALIRLVQSIRRFFPASQITIADDGNLRLGTDANSLTCCRLIDEHPEIRLLELPFASGVTYGRNQLVAQTQRPFLVFLDDDFEFTEQTHIHRLWDRLQQDSAIGVVAGACIDVLAGQRQLRNSGGTFTLHGSVLEIQTGEWRNHSEGEREYVPQFALIRREVFQDVRWEGGIGGEHYDFCLQLMHSSWKVVQEASVTVDHHPLTAALPGYDEYRLDCSEAQQWLLQKWNLKKIVQNGAPIVERIPDSTEISDRDKSSSCERFSKDLPYFDFARPEVADLVPQSAQNVLDIGCGAGRLGQLLKERQGCRVTGIEPQLQAAALARLRLDRVLEQYVEDSAVEFPTACFDCIICADVLEHLREPTALLAKIRNWLSPAGCLVLSLPNARHHSVVSGLLDGNWTYEAAGLLDEDHVRFFTRREIEKLLFRQGFEIETLVAKPGPGHAEWVARGRPGSVRVGALQIDGLSPDSAEEFFTYQYLAIARSAMRRMTSHHPAGNSSVAKNRLGSQAEFGRTSIIIVTFNELAYTKECLESLRLRTDEPYELIVIDNGSSDGTPDYLESLRGVTLIRNAENRGFPAAVNQGLRVATGEQVLLLNNDTVLSTGWLRKLLTALESDPRIGLVGPCSNNVSGSQMILTSYTEMSCMDGFAWDWGKQNAHLVEETERLIGFCLLIRQAVIEQIGGLDEQFGIGCYEDDDICLRALQAGWKVVIARDAFVHHYGSRTFAASGVDFAALLQVNREKFLTKWDQKSSADRFDSPGQKFAIREAEEGGLLLVPASRPQLSLCMIVRNNQATIGPCLESIRPWVDEMIVVDTGSTDATPQICAQLGAQVFHWPWCDDFSAARNQSLSHATGEWVFWMDSDDTIPADCGQQLRVLVRREKPADLFGYVLQVHCPGADGNLHDKTVVDHVKLFRNHPQLRFEHRIHEQILPAIRRLGGSVEFTDIYVVHSGSDHSPAARSQKLERDFRLLQLDLAERPDHPFVLFNLGMTYADSQQSREAVNCLTRCLDVSQPEESHVRKAYSLLVSCLMQLSNHEHAATVCLRGRKLFPQDKELAFRHAMLAHLQGQLQHAVELYREVLAPSQERHFVSVDAGLTSFKARHNLALVYEDLGDWESAESQWQHILVELPDYVPAYVGLAECLMRRGDFTGAEQLVSQLRSRASTADGIRLTARLAEFRYNTADAIVELRRGIRQFPGDSSLLRELARLLHDTKDYASALEVLEQLIGLLPADGSAWHNRAVVLGLLNRNEESQSAFAYAASLRTHLTAAV